MASENCSHQTEGMIECVELLVCSKEVMTDGSIAPLRRLCKSAAMMESQELLLEVENSPYMTNTLGESIFIVKEPEVTIEIGRNIQNHGNGDGVLTGRNIQDHGNGDGVLLPDCCRVPSTIRRLYKEPYTPKVVSIGPFHHGNERLQDMELLKKMLYKRFTERALSSMDDLDDFALHSAPAVRASYPETIHGSPYSTVLSDMILHDAGFIIELFIMSFENKMMNEGGNNDIAKLIQPWLANCIHLDLLLLENQLPFFFIEGLFNIAFPHGRRSCLPSFDRLTFEYFSYHNVQKVKPNPDVKIKHFTDLLRLFYLQGNMAKRQSVPKDGSHKLLYNANALQEAGIKMEVYGAGKHFLDFNFSGNILQIPQIVVDDNTESLFRNMIALEQCHYPYDAYITDYALVLDWLIDTNRDVDILVHKKIVTNHIGDTNNVALLFNGLVDNVVQPTFNSDFANICGRLNSYCGNYWIQMRATLKHDYFRTPWQTVATIAAIVLLLLTLLQTVLSILQVV